LRFGGAYRAEIERIETSGSYLHAKCSEVDTNDAKLRLSHAYALPAEGKRVLGLRKVLFLAVGG